MTMEINMTNGVQDAQMPKAILSQKEVLLAELSEKADVVALAMNEGKPESDIKALKTIATNALSRYNREAANATYRAWRDEGDPVKRAITALYISDGKRLSYRPDKKTGMVEATISDAKIRIDLYAMQACIGEDVFYSGDWTIKTQALAFMIANAINKGIGSAEFEYEVDKAAREFRFPEEVDITSNKSMVKAMQQCVDAIIFIPSEGDPEVNAIKMIAYDWKYIREVMTHEGNDYNKVAVASHRKMVDLLVNVIKVRMEDGKYELTSE